MPLTKPPGIARDAFKSAKWDELVDGRSFAPSDAPVLALLVQWYAVAQRCIDDIDDVGGQVAYRNDMGDLKALPQISTMKQASAEIRQLNKQLGINDEGGEEEADGGADVLKLVLWNREARRTRAKDKGRAAV